MNIQKKLTVNSKEIVYGKNLPETIIIHHTGGYKPTLYNILRFFRRLDYLSVHFIVGRTGSITQYVDEKDVAFHAGVSKWNGLTNLNYHSIGIEVVSDGNDFTEAQRKAVQELCRHLMAKHQIPKENVIRHADVAGFRGKWDVGWNFYKQFGSWERFQNSLNTSDEYEDEKKFCSEWVKVMDISNGERPNDPITRVEMYVMLHRFFKKIKKEA